MRFWTVIITITALLLATCIVQERAKRDDKAFKKMISTNPVRELFLETLRDAATQPTTQPDLGQDQ